MYVGIDLGTSSVKLLLCDAQGAVQAEVTKEYAMAMPKPNWAEQNPQDWWIQTKSGLMELCKQSKEQITGISFSGQMHGLVILDEENQIIRPAILWCDQRTQKECDYLNQKVGLEKLVGWVGNQALTGFTAPKLLWLKEHEPENFKRIRKIMLPKDYIQYCLTSVFACDVSDASGTLMLDVKNKKWSTEMMEILSIEASQLPTLYESFQVTGTLTAEIAKELDLSEQTKVTAGAGDQAAGALGVGVVEPGVLSVALGTSGVVFLPCENYSADEQACLHSFAHANGKYHQMGVVLSAAGALKWWLEKVNESHSYRTLVEEQAASSEAKGLYFLPYLIGERTPVNDPDAKGCFIGLNLTHSKGDMTRAVLEGVSFALRESFEIIKEMKQPIREIRISGGGSNSAFWKQMIADIFQLPVTAIETAQGPAYGAAILACAGESGRKLESICAAWIRTSETFQPNRELRQYYDDKYKNYKLLYPALHSVFKKIGD